MPVVDKQTDCHQNGSKILTLKFKLKRSPEGSSKSVELYAVHTKILISYCFVWLFVATHSVCRLFYWERVLSINGALKLIKSQIDGGFQRQWEISTGNQENICVFENTLCPKELSLATALLFFHFLHPDVRSRIQFGSCTWFVLLICCDLCATICEWVLLKTCVIQFDIMSCKTLRGLHTSEFWGD